MQQNFNNEFLKDVDNVESIQTALGIQAVCLGKCVDISVSHFQNNRLFKSLEINFYLFCELSWLMF